MDKLIMVRRTTWIVLLVFGLLVLFAWLLPRYQSNKTEATAPARPTATVARLYDLTASQVVGINIVNSSGDTIEFTRDPESTSWIIKNLPTEQADSSTIQSVSAQLLSLQAIDTLTQPPPLDSIGLANPAYTITMVTTDEKQIATYVGSISAIGTGYYMRVDNGPVVIVDNVIMDDVLKLLKEPPVMATPTPEVTTSETGTPIAPAAQPTSAP